MGKKEKQAVRTLSKAFEALPEKKKEYLIGFAEGVVAAKDGQATDFKPPTPPGKKGA